MENVWIEWKGYGAHPVGKVAVKFRDNEIVEDEDAGYWAWGWVTGDRSSEIVAYKVLTDKKPKTGRKRPEFTFEDGVELAQDTCVHSGFLVVAIRYEDVFTDKDRLLAAQEYLRNTNYFNEYGYKPLRKKLKLYVKWLQSEMSKKVE